ncbi:nitrous oxide reductase family maturation protein NosD [Candidatus Parabeggiatoa sp. HSG14]|uniref:nitrous oxide reductase family maturation protein NosD n=1 Tax=Candidatus Parabeggiatoa sp. HSG14 TaxID=3055593 RepID=UPI0025A8CD31|nr:nitrous oxide reductase family maturation protein NosD [Thiotrichales bacterium HSG14]
MNIYTIILTHFFLVIVSLPSWAYPPLQPLIDAAKSGDTLRPPPGTYSGPIAIEIPITIDGNNQVTIDGGGKDTVVYLDTDGAQLRHLHLTNSGESHNQIDACIQVRGNFNVIKDNVLDNCLFGVDLQQSDYNIVRRNRISSKPYSLGLRGDAVRLWYSVGNKITHNEINNSRDTVVWYSKDNVIADNVSKGGRYALHFMYSQFNRVENNIYHENSTGIFLMYSDDVEIRGNQISHSLGATGMGIGFKESSNVIIENNRIVYCATGIYLDLSPYQPDTVNQIYANEIAYNSVGVLFHNDWHGNTFKHNQFKGNHTQISVQGASTASRNVWQSNYWDDYTGFDRNSDGIGDTPYKSYAYADQIWMDIPSTQFFKGSAVLELLNFLERLAPFSEPVMILCDPTPLINPSSLNRNLLQKPQNCNPH